MISRNKKGTGNYKREKKTRSVENSLWKKA
jgi:stalled ribosome alternative rescue factor ArfA